MITNFCFATSFNQLSFPDFRGDVVLGIDIAMDTLTLRKFSAVLVFLIRHFPKSLLARISPALKGMILCRGVSRQRHPFVCPVPMSKLEVLGTQETDRGNHAKPPGDG